MSWTNLPVYTLQYSYQYQVDYLDCVSASLCNIIYMMTGKLYSARALAQMSETDSSHGNNVAVVLWIADNLGLIPEELWPTTNDLSWNDFYAKVPDSVISKGEKLDIVLIPPDLTKSPWWTEIEFTGANNKIVQHLVAGITNSQYVDSEPNGQIKNFNNNIGYKTSIKINNPPNMNQTKVVLSKDGHTIYKAVPIATTWEDFVKQSNVEGITIPNPVPPASDL